MPLFNQTDTHFVKQIALLCYTNPFLPERIELERQALGSQFRDVQSVWSLNTGEPNPNVETLGERALTVVESACQKIASGYRATPKERELYLDLVRYTLFHEFDNDFLELAQESITDGQKKNRVDFYKRFSQQALRRCDALGPEFALPGGEALLFAGFFQIRRAFILVYENILGTSKAAAALRGAVWQSIFTYDLRRYQRILYNRMHEIPTLITGPSGTGKELVARAIGLSRYLPFDPATLCFHLPAASAFYSLNVSALAPTVVESELFGHKRGAFTGAVQDKTGWLEITADSGTIFLDEIGELDPSIQVKLLRVLQTREFQRVGDTRTLSFNGKLITATNRDLVEEIRKGTFREDLYYRLYADVIVTPSLQQQLADCPEDLCILVTHVLTNLVSREEALTVCDDVIQWIEKHLGQKYTWPGNVRELEQCVRSVLVRGSYQPAQLRPVQRNPFQQIMHRIQEGAFTAEQLLDTYCTLVYAREENYQRTAKKLEIDRRTVKARVDTHLLRELKQATESSA